MSKEIITLFEGFSSDVLDASMVNTAIFLNLRDAYADSLNLTWVPSDRTIRDTSKLMVARAGDILIKYYQLLLEHGKAKTRKETRNHVFKNGTRLDRAILHAGVYLLLRCNDVDIPYTIGTDIGSSSLHIQCHTRIFDLCEAYGVSSINPGDTPLQRLLSIRMRPSERWVHEPMVMLGQWFKESFGHVSRIDALNRTVRPKTRTLINGSINIFLYVDRWMTLAGFDTDEKVLRNLRYNIRANTRVNVNDFSPSADRRHVLTAFYKGYGDRENIESWTFHVVSVDVPKTGLMTVFVSSRNKGSIKNVCISFGRSYYRGSPQSEGMYKARTHGGNVFFRLKMDSGITCEFGDNSCYKGDSCVFVDTENTAYCHLIPYGELAERGDKKTGFCFQLGSNSLLSDEMGMVNDLIASIKLSRDADMEFKTLKADARKLFTALSKLQNVLPGDIEWQGSAKQALERMPEMTFIDLCMRVRFEVSLYQRDIKSMSRKFGDMLNNSIGDIILLKATRLDETIMSPLCLSTSEWSPLNTSLYYDEIPQGTYNISKPDGIILRGLKMIYDCSPSLYMYIYAMAMFKGMREQVVKGVHSHRIRKRGGNYYLDWVHRVKSISARVSGKRKMVKTRDYYKYENMTVHVWTRCQILARPFFHGDV